MKADAASFNCVMMSVSWRASYIFARELYIFLLFSLFTLRLLFEVRSRSTVDGMFVLHLPVE